MKYHKVKWDQVPMVDEASQHYLDQLNQRNRFHNFPTNQWFKRRSDQVKPQYLYYPEERKLQMELKQIFMTLDCNNDGVLTLAHLFMLFKHYGYGVSVNDLQTIYQFIDYNKDKALSLDEFKGLTENQEALQAFRNMMLKIQKTLEYTEKYVPLSVGAMLSHISYLVQREKQLKMILSEQSISIKFQAFRQLIQETEKKTIADEAYTLFLKAQAEFQRKLRRQNSVDLTIKVRKSFSTINGLQPLLFRNMLMKDASELQDLAKMVKIQSKVNQDTFQTVTESLDESSLSNIESTEIEQVVKKAQQKGKLQANQEIRQLLTQRELPKIASQHRKQLSVVTEDLPPIQFNLKKCHSTNNKSLLERQLKLQKIIPAEELSQFNFLSSSRSNKNYSSTQEQTSSENQGGWSNSILSMKLPTLQ
ncbi:unnamed protein product [Paramecium pentaurelia]|uniref:EF-hand domain-containing protein n=1 Tax=Paramecium pentaurelia TaxID=43138 RepID=A0A8S1X9K7_9CILI|nr:unnamed protein product [Paramecium pentaurelia]